MLMSVWDDHIIPCSDRSRAGRGREGRSREEEGGRGREREGIGVSALLGFS